MLDDVCTHVTSSAASRYSAAKLMILGCTLKPASNFSMQEKCKNMVMRFQSPLVYNGAKERMNYSICKNQVNSTRRCHAHSKIIYKHMAPEEETHNTDKRRSTHTSKNTTSKATSSLFPKEIFLFV